MTTSTPVPLPSVPPWLRDLIGSVEEDERLDAAADLLGRATPIVGDERWAAFLRGEWLGHALHPLLTDLPLGCWTSAALLDLFGGRAARPAAQRLVAVGLLAVPITALSGLADWSATTDEKVGRVGAVHAFTNLAATAVYLASWRARRSGHHGAGVALGLVGAGVVAASGYLGGHLSFTRGVGVGPRGLGERDGYADAAEPLPAAAAR